MLMSAGWPGWWLLKLGLGGRNLNFEVILTLNVSAEVEVKIRRQEMGAGAGLAKSYHQDQLIQSMEPHWSQNFLGGTSAISLFLHQNVPSLWNQFFFFFFNPYLCVKLLNDRWLAFLKCDSVKNKVDEKFISCVKPSEQFFMGVCVCFSDENSWKHCHESRPHGRFISRWDCLALSTTYGLHSVCREQCGCGQRKGKAEVEAEGPGTAFTLKSAFLPCCFRPLPIKVS